MLRISDFIEISFNLPDEEIYQIQIYRAKEGESPSRWETIKDITKTTIQDRSIQLGQSYQYQMKYITTGGMHSLP